MEYLVIIIGFIVGVLISNWISSRGNGRRRDEGRRDEGRRDEGRGEWPGEHEGHAQPGWQPPRVRLPAPVAGWVQYFPVTAAFIAVCVVIALLSGLGQPGPLVNALLIADRRGGLEAVLSGEVWRLITPIFLHFGMAHIMFNMFALWDLGRVVEITKGSRFVLVFTLLVGIASNLAQYLMTGSPFFGGMSGVLYGLFGYVWMQGKYNPRFGITLTQHTVVIMLVWFGLCWSGFLGPIANWAHTAGLVAGAAWGYARRHSPR